MFKNMRIKMLLAKIEKLENEKSFITPFFCGETMYPRKLAEWEKKHKKAKNKLDLLEKSKQGEQNG